MASPFARVGATVDAATDTHDSNFSAAVTYTTKMQSAEAHSTTRVYSGSNGDASLLFGARFLAIDESLTYTSSNWLAAPNVSVLTNVENRLFGPQVGLLTETIVPGGLLNINLKFALTYNSIDKTTVYDELFVPARFLGQGDSSAGSAVGEFDIEYLINPAPNCAIRIGCQLLGVTNVALATENFENSLVVLSSGMAKIDTTGVLYFTPYLGVLFTR
jgi:hypothetical protein